MKQVRLFFFLLSLLPSIATAQQTYLQVYGQVQADLNRGHEIVQLNDTTFVIGGEWNGTGYLMRVNHTGAMQDVFFLDNAVPGTSKVTDLSLDAAGNVLAVGECEHCSPVDTLKRVFALTTEPSLLLIQSKVFEGALPSNPLHYNPSLARKGNQFVVASSIGGPGLNFEDVALTALTANLDTLWRKVINTCGNCGFDFVTDLVPTNGGYALLVLNAFTDSLTLLHVNESGNLIWKKRHHWATGTSFSKLAYRNGTIFVGGSEPIAGASPAHTGGFVRRYSEVNGSLLGSLNLDVAGMNDEVAELQFSSDGTLLAAHRRAEPNSIGAYQVSRIYRLNSAGTAVLDFTEIPNPDVLTNMGATAVVPMTADGSEFAACGIRGFYNRTFFFSKNSLEPQPPGEFFTVSTDTACAPATIVLTNNFPNAQGYQWFLNGVLFSSEEHPAPLTIPSGGVYEIELQAQFGTQNNIDDFVLLNLPEIWNECAFCDNQPDPYLKVRNGAGVLVYETDPIEDYPPMPLPVNLTMNVNDSYEFEVWDSDNVGSDDFFGSFNIPGNTPGGTFSLIHPDDPDDPLSISFTTQLNLTTQSFSRTVIIYQPSASLSAGDTLSASPGIPAPASYAWQWYLDGQPILGATGQDYPPTASGTYAVAMLTPECMALSNTVVFTAPLTLDIQSVSPLCPGDYTGSILVTPIGGMPPYTYAWNFPTLMGNHLIDLPGGIYEVTVTDAAGGTASAVIELDEPVAGLLHVTHVDPTCNGGSDGSILVIPTAGSAPFTYDWTPAGPVGDNPMGLDAGGYGVMVTDANGCQVSGGAILSDPPALTSETTSTPQIATTSTLGTASVTVEGGTPPYLYLWNTTPPQTTEIATELQGGTTYLVIVEDANGCELLDSVYVDLFTASGEAAPILLRAYPNPTNGVVFLEWETPGEATLRVSDLVGREVLTEILRQSPATVDLSGLAAGAYFFVLKDEGRTWVGRIVLQR